MRKEIDNMGKDKKEAKGNKIPTSYNDIIYDKYTEYLDAGVPISRVASLLNEELGTNYPESSMRGRYTQMRDLYETEIDDETHQARLFQIAKGSIRLKTERKIIGKERTIVDTLARQIAEHTVVSEIMRESWGKSAVENLLEDKVMPVTCGQKEQIYAFADVHWGYVCDLYNNVYNNDVAKRRIREMFDAIIAETSLKGYKHIYVADLGDQIEGSALRISQLVRTAEDMTLQARNYANVMVNEYKRLSKMLPEVEVTVLQITADNHSQLRLYGTQRNEMPENLSNLIGNELMNTFDTAHEFGGMLNMKLILGDEILISIDGYNMVFAHGHQYGRKEDVLDSVEKRHRNKVHAFIAGHWHQFSVKYKDVKDDGQQALIFLPAVVGDTDFSETLFVSGLPGFCKITVDTTHKVINAEMKPLTIFEGVL